jgi:hypothetical protein
LVASGWAVWAGIPAAASRSANQPPAVGGRKGDLDRRRLQLTNDAQELDWPVADPPRQHHLTGGIQGDHV